MRIGIYLRLFGRPGTTPPPPDWRSILDGARAAEAAGFDRIVLEDGLLYPDGDGVAGLWDPISIAAAIAAVTTRIGISHAVLNNPYHHPAIVARAAATLDEISGGRYSLGIGLGNTPDDYPRFGIPADRRYSRFAEAIQVIRGLLRDGRVSFEGEFHRVPDGELVLRGPRPTGPPIVIAGQGPRMLELVARYADEWNWWTGDPAAPEPMRELVEAMDRACDAAGRDPASLGRSIDLFTIAPPDASTEAAASGSEIAATITAWKALGFDEARIALDVPEGVTVAAAIESLGDVVREVHAA